MRTPICDLLGIEVPIMQAAIWPATAPELVAAVSEAGGLGSIGSVFESAESVERQIARVQELTGRPFAVNHVVPLLDEEAFEATLEAKPTVVSLALSDPGDFVPDRTQGRRDDPSALGIIPGEQRPRAAHASSAPGRWTTLIEALARNSSPGA